MEAVSKLFRNILCPIDFDANSPAALEFGAQIASETGARICILHVVPWTVAAVPIDASQVLAELKQSATERLQQLAEDKLHKRIAFEIVVTVASDPGAEVIRVANELKANVIIMATHGRKGLSHLVLGSVAERVVREAPCPVLTLRAKPQEVADPALVSHSTQ
jgi:nucleotide-binding universal stress UspA family protein